MWRVLQISGKKRKANGTHETINHFVRNFAKCPPILKINSFNGKLSDKFVVKQHTTT